jgi:ADYC domain
MRSCGRLYHFNRSGGVLLAALVLSSLAPCHAQDNTSGIDVVGTMLRVRLPDGTVRAGAELVGGILNATFGGRALRVRIAGVEKDRRDPLGEVLLYDFRLIAPDGSEQPACKPDPDGRPLGLALAGRTDPAGILTIGEAGVFELICTAAPQAKCLRLGYAPWRKTPDGRTMIDWFNSCVRLFRGDYCGDGRPFTRDGTWIDVYDRIGVQKSDEDPTLRFEAAWGPDGAICVARTRLPDIIDLDTLAKTCPRLAGRLGPQACTDQEQDGLLLNRSR